MDETKLPPLVDVKSLLNSLTPQHPLRRYPVRVSQLEEILKEANKRKVIVLFLIQCQHPNLEEANTAYINLHKIGLSG